MNIPVANFFLPKKKNDKPTVSIIKIKGVNQGDFINRSRNACTTGVE